jgi:hypothetical protein
MGFKRGTANYLKQIGTDLGAAVFFVSRLAWGSVASSLMQSIDQGIVEAVAWLTYVLQDETPMSMRVKDAAELVPDTLNIQPAPEAATVKVVQSEVVCGFIVKEVSSGAFRFVWTELPTALLCVRSASAAQLKSVVDTQFDSPLTAALALHFPFRVDLSTGDRASSNLLMERMYRAFRPTIPRLAGLGCQVHCLHTVCGKVVKLPYYSDVISCCIALALSQRAAGSIALLRNAIAQVLKDSTRLPAGPCPYPAPALQMICIICFRFMGCPSSA